MKWVIVREDADPLADLRISIGYSKPLDGAYIVFRGDPRQVSEFLDTANAAMSDALNLGTTVIEDRRWKRP